MAQLCRAFIVLEPLRYLSLALNSVINFLLP